MADTVVRSKRVMRCKVCKCVITKRIVDSYQADVNSDYRKVNLCPSCDAEGARDI